MTLFTTDYLEYYLTLVCWRRPKTDNLSGCLPV